jgi:hypothetical protein
VFIHLRPPSLISPAAPGCARITGARFRRLMISVIRSPDTSRSYPGYRGEEAGAPRVDLAEIKNRTTAHRGEALWARGTRLRTFAAPCTLLCGPLGALSRAGSGRMHRSRHDRDSRTGAKSSNPGGKFMRRLIDMVESSRLLTFLITPDRQLNLTACSQKWTIQDFGVLSLALQRSTRFAGILQAGGPRQRPSQTGSEDLPI